MKLLTVKNPFGAPVYHEETVSSTFDASRLLAEKGESHGTVVAADFQEAGRGRNARPWAAARGENLLFTILLRYKDFQFIPEALTLRTGLAVSLAVEDMVPALAGQVKVKWPNDIMIGSRKAVGILTESDGKIVYIGVGVNVYQREFPAEYRFKVESIIQAYPDLGENIRFVLLEKILSRLYDEIEAPSPNAALSALWRERLTGRLYKKGETVTFAEGNTSSNHLVEGTLSGIGPGGELLIIPKGEEKEHAFVTGELRVY
jgi:BirA family biotin operon repressor/biotin-[acetyl-CoA-carboxylase] ligase